MEQQDSPAIEDSRAASEGTEETPAVNPRKRKKSSRACDFCHSNHQPCDNIQPRCGYCEKHNKPCHYLRPQKKRGPAQGYRTALHTMRESAAAWGVALNLIPSLGPVIEGYLKQSEEGKRLVKAIKDPHQQEFFIQAWQQSGVFSAFFGDDAVPEKPAEGETSPAARPPESSQENSVSKAPEPLSQPHVLTPAPSQDGARSLVSKVPPAHTGQGLLSFTDIVAKDAERSFNSFSRTLGSLGFAPDETLDDFLAMSFNPDPLQALVEPDSGLGTPSDQRAYYELLMGRQIP